MIGELEINQLRLESAKVGLLVQAIIERLGLSKDYPITGKTNLVDLPGFNDEILESMSVRIAGKKIDFLITPGATVEDFSKALMIQGDFQQTAPTYHKIEPSLSDPDQNIINKEYFFPKILPTEHIIGYPVPHLDPDLKRYSLTDEQSRGYFINNKAKPAVDATAAAEAPVGGQEPATTGKAPADNDQLIDPLTKGERENLIDSTLLPLTKKNLIEPIFPPPRENNYIKPIVADERPINPIDVAEVPGARSIPKEAYKLLLELFQKNPRKVGGGQEPNEGPDQVTPNDDLETTQ